MNKQSLKHRLDAVKQYISKEGDLVTGIVILAVIGLVVLVGYLIAKSGEPNIVYQPTSACDLFTPEKAQKLFDEDVHRVDRDQPVIADETATSKCSYTKLEQARTDPDNLVVAAIAVRSGINDEGVAQNKKDFALAQKSQKGKDVDELKQKSFYAPDRGQLNILDGRKWIILSYGPGNDPLANELDDMLDLADIILTKD